MVYEIDFNGILYDINNFFKYYIYYLFLIPLIFSMFYMKYHNTELEKKNKYWIFL